MRQLLVGWTASLSLLCGLTGSGQELPPAPSAAVTPTAHCTDWIVSVRHCPKRRSQSHLADFDVIRLDRCDGGQSSSLAELVASLQPGVPVCLVLHGSFVNWPTVCDESRQAQRWFRQACPGQPVHLIFFTWPSDHGTVVLFPMDVAILGRRASRHAQDVAQLIGQISDDHPICLVGHSHGARMAVATLHLLGGGSIDGICCPAGPYPRHRMRAVLAAAAFDHEWLNPGECYDRAVCRAEGILNLQNRHDWALALYPLNRPGAARALGRSGLTGRDEQKLGPWSHKLIDLDVTDNVGHKHIWPAYLSQTEIAQAIAPYVFFADPSPL